MRHLLPFVAALLLVSNSADAQTTKSEAVATEKNGNSNKPAATKQRAVSFFLEEITPAKTPRKPEKKSQKNGGKQVQAKAAPQSSLKKKIAQQQPISSHFQQAIVFQSMGLAEHAITEYRDALKDDPKFASTYNNLAQCLINRNADGDKEEALKLLNEASKLEPDNIGTLHALGLLKERDKDYTGAEAAYNKVLKVQPLNMSAIKNLSEMYFNLGKKEKAREVLVEAIRQHSLIHNISSNAPNNQPDQQASILKEALANLDKPVVKEDDKSTKTEASNTSTPAKTAAK